MKLKEHWRIVINYENYAVSSHGRVRNLNSGKLLKPQMSKRAGEYLFINLYKDGKRKNANIHVLVAIAFIGPRPPGMLVHHKDNNRQNPMLDNLEYVTFEYNAKMRRYVVKQP